MSANATKLSDAEENAVALKNVWLYLVCQALGGASAPINIALGAVVGAYLLGEDKSLATVPVTGYNIGVAIGALVANAIMSKLGRKRGFMIGCFVGISGMLVSGYAIAIESFSLFVFGLCINGISSGFVQQYRFAAADRGTAEFKPKAISMILAGGIAAAIIGPQLVILASDLADPVPYAGAFYSATVLFVLSFAALTFLNPSNLSRNPDEPGEKLESRSLLEIGLKPRFVIAVLCGTSSYALMSYVMTAAPLAMIHHGHSLEDATLGIQWHVMAMFAPSLVTGPLIARFGKEAIVATGLLILIACGFVALAGVSLLNFWGGLILLGIGWNFGFIGATAMVTDTYGPHEKNKTQGLNDFILFGSVALASFLSGLSLNAYGWDFLNWMIFPVALLCLCSLGWLKTQPNQ